MSGFPRTKKHEAPDDPNAGECPAPSEELAGRSAAAGAAEQEVHGDCGPRTSPGEVGGTERQNGEQKATSELCPSCSASWQPQAHMVCREAQRCPDPLHVPSSHRCEGHLGCLQASRPAHPQQSGRCPKERLRPRPLRQRCTELGGCAGTTGAQSSWRNGPTQVWGRKGTEGSANVLPRTPESRQGPPQARDKPQRGDTKVLRLAKKGTMGAGDANSVPQDCTRQAC